jgi:hypothetical protein
MSAMATQEQYEQVLRDALEDVFVVAVRQGIDTGQIAAQFDTERGSGPHQEHTLTISVRDTALTVTADGIAHEWISTGTGFIDTRFSRRIAAMLSDLERMAQREGRFI